MSLVFRKPMVLRRKTDDSFTGRPSAAFSSNVTVHGATRHRLDNRIEDGGDIIQQEQLVYLPSDVAIAAGDRLEFDGAEWVVIGTPFEAFSHRTRSVHHLEVRVRTASR